MKEQKEERQLLDNSGAQSQTVTATVQEEQLIKAMIKAKLEMRQPVFDSVVDYKGRKFKYASLSELLNCVTKPLLDNGLMLMQPIDYIDGQVFVVTTLLHYSGGKMSFSFPVVTLGKTMQDVGGMLTYSKRYALAALFGLAAEDDTDNNEPEGLLASPQQVYDLDRLLGEDKDIREKIFKAKSIKSLTQLTSKDATLFTAKLLETKGGK